MPLAAAMVIDGELQVALVAAGGFALGSALLTAFPEYGRALLSLWRPACGVVLWSTIVLVSLVLAKRYVEDFTFVLLALPLAWIPVVRLFARLSRELSGKLAPNNSLKRTNQSLRD